MMNIQQPVRLIIFIYQEESLLCCSMSIGYWCNLKWVLFSYMGGDISRAPPKQQQQQQQETAGGWSEHRCCKWWEGLSRSSHHGSHFCSGRQGGGHTGACHARPPPGAALFSPTRWPPQHRPLEPVLGPGGHELKAHQEPSLWCRCLCFCAWEGSLLYRCNLHITVCRAVKVLWRKEAQRAPLSYMEHLYEPDLFRSEVFLWAPLSVDFFLHLDHLGQY